MLEYIWNYLSDTKSSYSDMLLLNFIIWILNVCVCELLIYLKLKKYLQYTYFIDEKDRGYCMNAIGDDGPMIALLSWIAPYINIFTLIANTCNLVFLFYNIFLDYWEEICYALPVACIGFLWLM